MLPIRTILHPSDFSRGSNFAFEFAQALARDYSARIVVMHVVEPPTALAVEGALVFQPEINWQSLRQRLSECCPSDSRIPVEYVVVEGGIATEILRMAQDYKADVIVIGTHGRTGLSRLVMGSVAEQVLRRAPCPVLTVKQPVREAVALVGEMAESVATSASGARSEHG